MERECCSRVATRGSDSDRQGRLVDRDWNFDLAAAREEEGVEEEEGVKEMERW
jgi:hypothetical protein